MTEWWQTFFDETYFAVGLRRIDRRKTLADARFLHDVLSLKKGSKILDVCCGVGRHALELAKAGYDVTGVDLSKEYLELGRKRARKRGLEVKFEQYDMRRLPYKARFNAVISMWTSFGYFEKEQDNLRTLKRIHRALKRGGKFLIEVINRDWIVANFEAVGWTEIGNGYILEKRDMDTLRSRLNADWTYITKDQTIRKRLSLRIYTIHELVDLLGSAGFRVDRLFGDRTEGAPTRRHRMSGVLARK